MSEDTGPDRVAGRRHAAARDLAEALRRRERQLSNGRLAVFVIGVGLGWWVFGVPRLPALVLLPPVALFVALVVAHDRLLTRLQRQERLRDHWESILARLEDRWAGRGPGGEAWRQPDHLYAEDLDLFGDGSLFQRLCLARTPAGEERLAAWLQQAAEPAELRARQAAVAELRDRLELREDLAAVGEDGAGRLDPGALVRWGAEAPAAAAPVLRGLAPALVGVQLLALALWVRGPLPPLAWVAALGVQAGFAWVLHRRAKAALGGLDRPLRDLRTLARILGRIEGEPVASPRLVALRARLETAGRPPSGQIRALQRLVDLADARRNQLFAPIGALLLWGTQTGLAVERWRAECGPQLGGWVESVADFEALASLAGYAWERPEDPFPELLDPGDQGPVLDVRGLGHPLLPDARCVRNDLRLDREHAGLVVSGSNMSGKSTLLRSVGTNVVLAQAGAPVRAHRLALTPLEPAASIRVHDSLLEGRSRFYAEIERLHAVVRRCDGERTVLFLLDEILHGTNSHDRRIGAEALIRGLLSRGALGLVTTHDLALAEISASLAPKLHNVHFVDHLEDGEIHFDYRLRPGVVERSNALALMRAVGLEV